MESEEDKKKAEAEIETINKELSLLGDERIYRRDILIILNLIASSLDNIDNHLKELKK